MLKLVRCPSCQDLSEIAPSSVGQLVACPFCQATFRAELLQLPTLDARPEPPTVYPAKDKLLLDADEVSSPSSEPTNILWAMALFPLCLPLLWYLGQTALKMNPVFSVILPSAIGLGLLGINIGIMMAQGWRLGTKIKSVAAVGLMGLLCSSGLLFLKKEWAESFKNQLGPSNLNWEDYEPLDRAYRAKLPGRAVDTITPLDNWNLKAVRTSVDGRRARGLLGVIYTIAHGPVLSELKDLPDEDCFARVHQQLEQLGQVNEPKMIQLPHPASDQECPGREWIVALPDGVTNRIVRVYRLRQRGEDRCFYLAVEGAFVTPEAKYVQDFMKTFALGPLPRR